MKHRISITDRTPWYFPSESARNKARTFLEAIWLRTDKRLSLTPHITGREPWNSGWVSKERNWSILISRIILRGVVTGMVFRKWKISYLEMAPTISDEFSAKTGTIDSFSCTKCRMASSSEEFLLIWNYVRMQIFLQRRIRGVFCYFTVISLAAKGIPSEAIGVRINCGSGRSIICKKIAYKHLWTIFPWFFKLTFLWSNCRISRAERKPI